MRIERSKPFYAAEAMLTELYSERDCFKEDRRVVVQQLKAVANEIENGATEMAMVAAEGVFDERLSKILTVEARAMRQVLRELNDLRLAVSRARFPRSGK